MREHCVVGHNLKGFDLPYILRSSIITGADVFGSVDWRPLRGRYWDDVFFDTMEFWGAGVFNDRISLDALSKCIGSKGKNGNGKLFYTYSRADQEAYLENDLKETKKIFDRIDSVFHISHFSTIVDIETAPKSDAEIMALAPEFKPENVKTGNLKDPAKIEEKIEAARESHYDDIISKAALDPRYSVPVAIGYIHHDGNIELDFGEPKKLIERFWEVSASAYANYFNQG